MAYFVGELSASVDTDTSGFDKSMRKIKRKGERTAKDVQKSFRDIGGKLMGVGTAMTAGITVPLGLAGVAAIKTAAEFESLQQAMSTLNGSAEEGARQFKRLQEFAATTPFQITELVEAQNMLQGFGLSADEAYESLKDIGDIAAISSGTIKGIGIAFGQAAAEGRLMTRDIRQLINQGVPAIGLLANSMGVAKDAVLDLASQGEISFEDLQKAFRDTTSAGGLFFEGMEKQSKTLGGVFSNFRDNVDIIMAEVGNAMADAFQIKDLIRDVTANIQTVIDSFTSLSAGTQKATFIMIAMTAALPPLLAGLGALSLAIGAITWPVAAAAAIIAGLGAIAFKVIQTQAKFESLEKTINNLNNVSLEQLKTAVTTTMDLIALRASRATTILGSAYQGIRKLLEAAGIADFKGIDDLTQNLKQIDAKILERLAEAAQSLPDNQRDILLAAIDDGAVSVASRYLELFRQINQQAEKANDTISGTTPNIPDAPPLPDLFKNLTAPKTKPILGNIDFGLNELDLSIPQKLFPPGSIAFMNQQLTGFREKMRMATNPQQIQFFNQKIVEMRNKIIKAKGGMTSAQMAAKRFTSTLVNGIINAVAQGKNLLGVLADLAKQLAKKALIFGIKTLFGVATGGAGGLLGSLFGGIFHGGGIVGGSGDVPIMAQAGEGVFTQGQMRALGLLINRPKGGGQIAISINTPDVYLDGRRIYENQKKIQKIIKR